MTCPSCDSYNITCVDTRPKPAQMRYRRYKCLDCDNRFSTVEVIFAEGARIEDYAGINEKLKKLDLITTILEKG